MRKILLIAAATATLAAGAAQAENYKCQIETYGRPSGFAGGFQKQMRLMKSYMPYKTFYVVTDGAGAKMYHSGDIVLDSVSSAVSGSPLVYTFRDAPVPEKSTSLVRETRFSLTPGSNIFAISLTMNPGSGYNEAAGAAYGTCVIE